jgi:phosphatidate cytidylyltransferase
MPLHLPTFLTRLGSAIVFAAIMLVGLLWNEWAFLALAALIQFLCLRDFHRLMVKINPDKYRPSWIPVIMQGIALLWLILTYFSTTGQRNYMPVMCMFPITIFLIAGLNRKNGWDGAQEVLSGLIYIALPMSLLVFLRMHSILLPLALILMIWTNDTMAYLVGSFIGKTPFSSISPKKTWEGTAGGALLTMGGAALYGYFSSYYIIIDWVVLAVCAAVAGTVGDLLESKLKRMADVKDSGTMMPGHGGALDRFDSLLVATPFAFAYAYVFMPALPLVIF